MVNGNNPPTFMPSNHSRLHIEDYLFHAVTKIVATLIFLPQSRNTTIPMGIPNPPLHNPLNCVENTRTSP